MLSKNKKLLLLVIVVTQVLFFLSWYFLENSRLSNPTAKMIVVKSLPSDPRDMISGNYMNLRYQFGTIWGFKNSAEIYGKCPESQSNVYAVLKLEGQYYVPDYLTLHKPVVNENQAVLQGECSNDFSHKISYGIEKYFISETATQPRMNAGSEVSLLIGDDLKAMIKSIKIDEVELKPGGLETSQNVNPVIVPENVVRLPVVRGLISWFDAAAPNSVVTKNQVAVTSWNNTTISSDLNAVQNDLTKSPTLDPKFMNGLPALVFNAQKKNFLMTKNIVSQDMVIFVVLKTAQAGVGNEFGQAYESSGVLWSDVGGPAQDIIPLAIGGGKAKFFTGSTETTLTNPQRIDDNKAHIIRVVRNTRIGKRKICIDGDKMIVDVNGGSTNLNANSQLVIGGNTLDGRYFDGGISEIIIYNNTLNSAEVSAIEQYLGKKWEIEISRSIQ